jgi:hypothetical protein
MKRILIILFLFISLVSSGTTYYVKTYNSGGRDAIGKNGSIGSEWASLSYACSRVSGVGDIIYVNSGDYTDNNRAVLALGVSIEGSSSAPPNITVGYVAGSGYDAYIYMNTSAGNAVNGNHTISYLNLDGNLTGTRAMACNYRSNTVIHHCNFVDFYYSGIRFMGCSSWNTTPTNTIPTGNKVYNCDFNNCTQVTGNTGYLGHIMLTGQNGPEIYNCTFDQRGRTAGENTDIMTGYQNRGVKIHDNVWYKDDTNGYEWDFFVEFHYSNGGFELYNNEFNGAAAWDASGNQDLYGYGFGLRVHDNTFQTTGPPPIDAGDKRQAYLDLESFTYTNDVYVYRNYFKYSRIGILYANVQISSDNVWIYDNIFENVGNSDDLYSYAIKVGSDWSEAYARTFSNIHILNNVIDCGASAYSGILVVPTGNINNIDIRNNIINGYFTYPIRMEGRGGFTPTVTNLNITNNILYGGVQYTINWAGTVTYTGGSHSDGNNLENVNPLFIGGSPYNWRLGAGSPAILAGVDVGLDYDYDNRAWNPTTPSIGAYEYGSASIPILTTNSITDITATDATGGGSISSDGGTPVTTRGVCWDISVNPTIANDTTINGTGTGSYLSYLTGLSEGLTYYVRAYATNGVGTAYGNQRTFIAETGSKGEVGALIKHLGVLIKVGNKLIKY